MTTSAVIIEKPTGTGNTPPKLRHIYCRCTRDAAVRIAFCGHQAPPGTGVPYDPRIADPDLCAVCIDLQKQGCDRCAK